MLKLEEVAEALRLRTWSVDCPIMTLKPLKNSSSIEYEGCGYFKQAVNGSISYKLYSMQPLGFAPHSIFPQMVAGRILSDDFYHQLDTVDMEGTAWRVQRTMPSISTNSMDNRQFNLATGQAYELLTTCERIQNLSSLKIMFFTDERVPENASTEVKTKTPDGGWTSSSSLDTAVFSTSSGDFSIFNRPGMLVVKVVCPGKFPKHFETRIVEALSFVLAKPLAWNVLECVEDGVETVRLRGKQKGVDAKLLPPTATDTIDMSGGGVWRLFDKYLTMVSAHTTPDFHPCSRHVFSVLDASAGTIYARGLALGVAVEGIVKDLFPDAAALPPTLKPAVQQLRSYFQDWPGFNDEATKKALFKRVEDMLGNIMNVSAKSRLIALAKQGAVHERHIELWGKLRNTTAHGVTQETDDFQPILNLCDGATVLMYHLIFRKVGYDGSYRDYSVHGYPTQHYRGRPPTEAEIAVSAYYLWKKANSRHGHDIEDWFAAKAELVTEIERPSGGLPTSALH